MTPGTAEALKLALRRAVPLTIVLLIVGIVAYNAFKQLQGPQYSAEARVLISTTDLGAALTGVYQPYIDPSVLQARELALANSSELLKRASERTGSTLDAIDADMRASGDNGILIFTATSTDADAAVGAANAVADEYVVYRAEITGRSIDEAIARIQSQLGTTGPDEDLETKLETLNLLRTVNSSNATLFESADGAWKTTPNPVRDSMVGAAIGLVLALLFSAAREALNTRVRSEADVEEFLDIPVLGSVPSFPKRTKLVLFGRHEDAFADTYALLAANVMRARDGSPTTVIAITSAVANEGKTLTSSNLAVALARRGANVTLVDLDLRKPSLAEVFRIPSRSPGLVHVLSGRATLADVTWRVALDERDPVTARTIVPSETRHRASSNGAPSGTRPGKLNVIAAGGSMRTGVGGTEALKKLVAQLREQSDVVLLDTPPALQAAEMSELSRNVDGVIVVVRQGTVSHRSLRGLSRQTRTWQAPTVGAILTDAETADRSYYYTRNK
jgi:Mrp family chromosome partitioning ATPase